MVGAVVNWTGGKTVNDFTNRVAETTGIKANAGESRVATILVNFSISLVMAGWVIIWLGWIVHGVWKISVWIIKGTAPVLTLRELGVSLPYRISLIEPLERFMLDTGLGLLLFVAGTAVYVIMGGVLLFILFIVIRSVDRVFRSSAKLIPRKRRRKSA